MKEFNFPLKDMFAGGLRSVLTNRRNQLGLTTSLNAVPTDKGLTRYRARERVFTDLQLNWPFPQLFLTKEKIFIGASNGIFLWDSAAGYVNVISRNVQSRWTFLDFSPFFLVNHFGVSWKWDIEAGIFVKIDEENTPGFPQCTAMENFKGQLITGGVLEYNEDDLTTASYKSRVQWGKIGTLDFTIDRRNQAGFTEIPGGGVVRKIAALERGFVVYTDKQIVYFYPVAAPVYTFGQRVLANVGVDDEACVGKGLNEHIVLTTDGVLCRVTDEGLQRLGYKEFFDTFKEHKVAVTYNGEDDEYYICNGYRTYVYRKEGLGELGQVITSGGMTEDGFQGWVSSPWDATFLIVSETFDMGNRGQKTIVAVEAVMDSVEPAELSIFWRSDINQSWRQTSWASLGPRGIANFPVAGVEFRVAFRVRGTQSVHFDTASIRWKMTDKRHIRGPYGGADR